MATKNNKNTKKTFKADITVDLTNAESAYDVYLAFAEAKMEKNMSAEEISAFMSDNCIHFYICKGPCPFCEHCEEPKPKKKNIFKRFWSWVTGK